MNKSTVDFKRINRDLMRLEHLVANLYDYKEMIESKVPLSDREDGMLTIINELLRHVEN